MMPSLFTFTLITAAVSISLGLPLLIAAGALEQPIRALPRSRPLGVITMLLGGGWFLWKITQLGQADFGDYKHLLFALFAATLVGSILYVRDFLAVRGIAVLVLLAANLGLKSAFGEYDIPERLALVSFLYAAIVIAIYLGVAPYVARDWINWLYGKTVRMRALGAVLVVCGGVIGGCAFAY